MQDLPPPPSYGAFLFETLLVLVGVCLLAWLVLRFAAKRGLLPGGAAADGPLRVVARLPLEPRRTLYLVEAAGKALLIGASEAGPLATLAELDRENLAVPPKPAPRSFLDILRAKP